MLNSFKKEAKMRTLKFSEREPSAFITTNGNQFRIYDGEKIFLTDGQNFEIRLFNPLMKKIGAEIILNGKGNGRILVLQPGQDIILDRFLDEKRKMVFETYTINADNQIAMKAIEENGSIVINFYNEKYMAPAYTTYSTNYRSAGPSYMGRSIDNIKLSKSISGNSGRSSGMSALPDLCDYAPESIYGNMSNTFSGDDFETGAQMSMLCESTNEIETGRVEKGEISNQNVTQVDVQFEQYPFHTIKYKLLPAGQYREIVSYQVKQYCPNCGLRIPKQNWKYCPKCGEQL